MSLVGTLGRVAMGVLVAKGVGKMMSGRSGGGTGASTGGGLGGMLGGLLGGQNGSGGAGASAGGLGGLGSLLGGNSSATGGGSASGGLGGLLEQIGGGPTAGAASAPRSGSLGDLLNRSLQGEQVSAPDAGQEALARVLIQAMTNAAKSDGSIDQAEQQKIVEHLGDDMTADERDFVLAEMRSPLDLDGFVTSVPRGAEKQVYMMSLMGIELDHPEEAKYLDRLRKALNISEQDANAIHQQLGAPTLYS